jgi:hypothetical protein
MNEGRLWNISYYMGRPESVYRVYSNEMKVKM